MKTTKKPRCGKGQSCGNSCIDAKDTCTELLDKDLADGLLRAVKRSGIEIKDQAEATKNSFSNPADLNLTFEQLQAKYPLNTGLKSEQEELGDGVKLWSITHKASDGSGDTMRYRVLETPDAAYTISDSRLKEVTAVAQKAMWQESLYAAFRAVTGSGEPEPARPTPTPEPPVETKVAGANSSKKPEDFESNKFLDSYQETSSIMRTLGITPEMEAAGEAKLAELMDRAEVRMRVPSSALDKIISEGFKNRFETGTSKGSMDRDLREDAEFAIVGISYGTKPSDRPVYGYIAGKDSTADDYALSNYGDVELAFKPSVKDGATFSADDSFMASTPATSAVKPGLATVFRGGWGRSKMEDTYNKIMSAESIDDLEPVRGAYVEAQLHNRPDPSTDIARIRFRGKAKPTEAVLAWAKKNSIEVEVRTESAS